MPDRNLILVLGDQLAGYATAGQRLGLDGTGPHLVTGPLYHAAPLGFAHMDLHNGAEVVVLRRLVPVTGVGFLGAGGSGDE